MRIWGFWCFCFGFIGLPFDGHLYKRHWAIDRQTDLYCHCYKNIERQYGISSLAICRFLHENDFRIKDTQIFTTCIQLIQLLRNACSICHLWNDIIHRCMFLKILFFLMMIISFQQAKALTVVYLSIKAQTRQDKISWSTSRCKGWWGGAVFTN